MTAAVPSEASLVLSADEAEWQRIIDAIEPSVREAVALVVKDHAADSVELFYTTLRQHPDAAPFLSNELVDTRLHAALITWLTSLFSVAAPDLIALVTTQKRIGLVHARIRVPIQAVMHGARLLKGELRHLLFDRIPSKEDLSKAIDYVENMMDMASETMSREFVRDLQKEIETDEAYRLVTLGQDINLEREIQKAALLDWGHRVLFAICCAAPPPLPSLEGSAFGLWLNHKGSLLFPGPFGLEPIKIAMRKIDHVTIPALLADAPPKPVQIYELQAQIEEIRFLMDNLFRTSEARESGRDPLTCTLNRRFLPTILSREVTQAMRREVPFSVLMLDIDHFKSVNDTFGHTCGDRVLRGVAEKIVSACRASDFIFRYGGEEFLIALVEIDMDEAFRIAERIREMVADASTDSFGVKVTVSIGVATFDGHPDYTHLIEDADKALYKAKDLGRNKSVAL